MPFSPVFLFNIYFFLGFCIPGFLSEGNYFFLCFTKTSAKSCHYLSIKYLWGVIKTVKGKQTQILCMLREKKKNEMG